MVSNKFYLHVSLTSLNLETMCGRFVRSTDKDDLESGFRFAHITYFFLALLFVDSATAQNSVVVPNSLTNIEGNSDNGYPFNCNCLSMRYQQVHLGSEIGSLNIY